MRGICKMAGSEDRGGHRFGQVVRERIRYEQARGGADGLSAREGVLWWHRLQPVRFSDIGKSKPLRLKPVPPKTLPSACDAASKKASSKIRLAVQIRFWASHSESSKAEEEHGVDHGAQRGTAGGPRRR